MLKAVSVFFLFLASAALPQVPEMTASQYIQLTAEQTLVYVRSFANDYAQHYKPDIAQHIREDFYTKDPRVFYGNISKGQVDATGWCHGKLIQAVKNNVSLEKVSMTKVMVTFFRYMYGPPPDGKK